MKIYIPCMECLQKDGFPNLKLSEVEINDGFIFKTTCNKGHESMTLFQQERFELLFDIGCTALIDGYYRESIFSIAAAVERFHEFFIRVVAIQRGIPVEEFESIWDDVSSQSERQLGAFYFLYLGEFKKAPPCFVETNAKLRNKVVHKGYIPSKQDAREYATAAFRYIISILTVLRADYSEGIASLTSQRLIRAIPTENKLNVGTYCQMSILGLIDGDDDWEKRSFDEAMAKFEERRKLQTVIQDMAK